MGHWQLVTAVIVGMTLGSAWPVGAESPQAKESQEQKRRAAQKAKTPAGPTNPATSQDKRPANTPGGLPSAAPNVGAAAGRIPGTGGAAKAQSSTGSTAAPMPAANTLLNPNADKPQGNKPPGTKVVTPETFKSKEERLNELANPGMPAPESGGDAAKKALERSGSDVLGGVSTTVAPSAGKNQSTTRQQQSEDGGGGSTTVQLPGNLGSVTKKMEGNTGVTTISGNNGFEATIRATNDGLVSSTVRKTDKEATVVVVIDHATKTTTTTVSWLSGPYAGTVFTRINDGEMKRVKTPNPETDTGDGHTPKGLAGQGRPQKSPSEVEAERRRQVTQPTDDQRRQFERMRMEADVALKSAMAKRTDGRIDPSREGTPGPGGFTGPIVDTRPRGVDGLPRTPPKGPGDFGQPITQPRGGGTTPDNPTASGGTGQATTGSEPPKR